jgi:hypothetical protein
MMVLVDTSVWIEHFRFGEPTLQELLAEGRVLMHPFVLGELACGNLKDRTVVLSDLLALPKAEVAGDSEVFRLIERRRLWGKGIGWVDAHLLASIMLSSCLLWTLDARLAQAAKRIRQGKASTL